MKNLLSIFLGILLVMPVIAQVTIVDRKTPTDEFHTIFHPRPPAKKIPLGYFIELNGTYTQFSSLDVLMAGVSVGIILNHNWAIGFSGSMIANSYHLFYHDIYYSNSDSLIHGAYFGGGYGGLLIEYSMFPRSLIHVAFPLLIGVGYMYWLDDYYYNSNYWNNQYWRRGIVDQNKFFVIEPGIRAEFNVFKKLRLGIGVSYRYSPKLNLISTPTNLINTFNAKINLRFGKF
jgi:hypothetical protein